MNDAPIPFVDKHDSDPATITFYESYCQGNKAEITCAPKSAGRLPRDHWAGAGA